jgi:hypothetical protein
MQSLGITTSGKTYTCQKKLKMCVKRRSPFARCRPSTEWRGRLVTQYIDESYKPVALIETRKGRRLKCKLSYFNELSVQINLLFLVNITCVASVRVYMKIHVNISDRKRERNSFLGIRLSPHHFVVSMGKNSWARSPAPKIKKNLFWFADLPQHALSICS